jgi:hypothetical protein
VQPNHGFGPSNPQNLFQTGSFPQQSLSNPFSVGPGLSFSLGGGGHAKEVQKVSSFLNDVDNFQIEQLYQQWLSGQIKDKIYICPESPLYKGNEVFEVKFLKENEVILVS